MRLGFRSHLAEIECSMRSLLDRSRFLLKPLFLVAIILNLALPSQGQLLLAGLGLLLTGIAHGALDHHLDPTAEDSKRRF